MSSSSIVPRDISSIDLVREKRKRFTADASFSNVGDASGKDPDPHRRSETKVETASSERFVDVDEKSNRDGRSVCVNEIKKRERLTASVGKGRESRLSRMSSSVPWIRARHSFRKKLKNGKRTKELSSGDGRQTFAPFRYSSPINGENQLSRSLTIDNFLSIVELVR
ncbi:uncharacterized protein LOC122535460 [Frieseomelitta varia]|uniref:uncharacterized protein LOC122535460 n=1 Tax=Frieseomelitta varia TaxID=561572 RepID=UPI001CB68D1B|nr:uncharacterized protein LOC122535460 [Frieseomelitta varia]